MRTSVSDALLRLECEALVERVDRLFPQNPAWTAWARRWLAGKPDDDFDDSAEEEDVRLLHAWIEESDRLTRPAPAVEGMLLGTDQILAVRTTTFLLSFLAFPDEEKARLRWEIPSLLREVTTRLDRVELERVVRPQPKLWRG